MNAPPRPNDVDPLPGHLRSAECLLDGVATAFGWLDGRGRLRWANLALLALIDKDRLPVDGLFPQAYCEDAEALLQVIGRQLGIGRTWRLPGVRLRSGGRPIGILLTALEEGGVLMEIHPAPAPATVPITASLRSLAHEFRNPLGGLRGAAQLLSRRVLDADLRTYADIIVAEADRLGALAERLLAPVARTPARAINIHTVLERVRLLLAAEGATVTRDYDPSLPECTGDGDRLVQIFLNLGRNAIEAGAADITLRTRFERDAALGPGRGPALRVDVVDDGAGVPEILHSTLFLPLVSGREGGTGLGLATAHEIAVEHGGRIGFESRPGHTVFSVWLPLETTSA
jgi:two-component system nitrogen regulation sensor histidine kinase GlnL